MDVNMARNQVRQAYATLDSMNKKDPEQEVRGMGGATPRISYVS
jgi:hypothetical protein